MQWLNKWWILKNLLNWHFIFDSTCEYLGYNIIICSHGLAKVDQFVINNLSLAWILSFGHGIAVSILDV